jgi:cytochrome c peroxidase
MREIPSACDAVRDSVAARGFRSMMPASSTFLGRSRRLACCIVSTALAIVAAAGWAPLAAAQAFSAVETRAVIAHGPWPLPWDGATSIPIASSPQAVSLGRRLFFDAGLSPSGKVSCSSCHRPERAWSDGRERGKGLGTSRRNTPSLLDVRLHKGFGWKGDVPSLSLQSIRPILDPVEMGSSAAHVQRYIASHSDLASAYRTVFVRSVDSVDATAALHDAAKSLAAFQATLVSGRTPFDDVRDGLSGGGDGAEAARLSEAARRGLTLFVGRAGCASCHSGPAFTDERIHVIGSSHTAEPYRTPGLRNVARTAPYLHDGSAPTLAAAISAHKTKPRLPTSDVAGLVAFLELLTSR